MKRSSSALVLFLTALLAVSCGEASVSPADTSASDTTEAVTTEAVTTDYLETLDLPRYDGETFTMLGPFHAERQTFASETTTGEPVNDALYRRDRETEEMFGIKIETVLSKDPQADASKTAMAGDDAYQVVIGTMAGAQKNLALKSLSMNLLDLPVLKLDAPWWCEQAAENLTVKNTIFFTTGPITPQFYFGGQVMAMNLRLAENYDITDVGQLVLDGGWTLDKLETYLKGTGSDVDGDGRYAENDEYGLVMESSVGAVGYYVGAGQKLCTVSGSSVSIDITNDQSVSLIDRLARMLASETVYDTCAHSAESIDINYFVNMFTEGRSLFAASSMSHVIVSFRSMNDDYVILPMPKLDEKQENYHTYSNPWCLGGVSVPVTVTDPGMAGSILETMAYLSWNYVRSAQYDITVKAKVAREPDADQDAILDMIFDNSYYDLNGVMTFGDSSKLVTNAITGKTSSFVSDYESMKSKVQNAVDAYLKVIGAE